MKSLRLIKEQIGILFMFAILISIGAIIHGVFLDLDFAQVKRLTLEGILLTVIVIFPAILFLEWIFDLNNREKFNEINKRLNKIEKKK